MTFRSGDRVGRYEVIETFDPETLCRVRHPDLGEQLVLRVVESDDEESRRRWETEARQLTGARHPAITPLLDFWQEDARSHWVVPITKGPTLGQMAARGVRVPVPVLLRILASVSEALHELHQRGIHYREFGPDSILLDDEGRAVLLNPYGYVLTAPSISRGYSCPETDQDRSPRSDVWGVGATLVAILTGSADPDPGEAGEGVDLQPLRGIVPELVVALIGRCLRIDPAERYETAEELQRALEGAATRLESPESAHGEPVIPRRGRILLLETEGAGAQPAVAYREFDLQLRLGGGAFGETYRARELGSGRDVAMKILKREWVSNEETVTRFRREAQLLARLSHRHIVGIRSFGRFGPSFFIAMELLEGHTLTEEIREKSPMEIEAVEAIAIAVGAGLRAVHEAGAVHRDIKPGNIMVGGGRIVLFDFGLARVGALATLTQSGEVLGSLRYMSPEQASGSEVTSASDIYSLGVVLYQALAGALPHQAFSAPELLQKIISQEPDPITTHRSGIPASRVEALDRMLDKDPDARPSAEQLPRLWGG